VRISFELSLEKLTPAQAQAGLHALQASAKRLIRDAKLLFNARRHTTAATLATMALQELARFQYIFEAAMIVEEDEMRELWHRFRSRSHTFPWEHFDHRDTEVIGQATDQLMNFVQTIGTGAEYLGAGLWTNPDTLIDRALADSLIKVAEEISKLPIHPRAIEIWLETLRSLPDEIRSKDVGVAIARFHEAIDAQG
jgi:AbiV family abortive infection protein